MKLTRYVAILPLLLAPVFVSAQTLPAFPMAFWGTVTLNGSPAPIGTIVEAYYGSTLAGSVTVGEAGVYGYTEPTKQKLVVGEGTGAITFKVQSAGFEGGIETTGDAMITQGAFSAGTTVEKSLAFAYAPPAPTSDEDYNQTQQTSSGGSNTSSNNSSSGGGGGGGGGIVYVYGVKINNGAATTSSPAVTLTITPSDNANQMWISNDASFSTSTWVSFQSIYPWTLASGDGTKTVYVRYGSNNFLISTTQASIQLLNSDGGLVLGASTQVLTDQQIEAILGLLRSFNADQSVIDDVSNALHGQGVAIGLSSGFKFIKTLQVGSAGNEVTELQKRLTQEGVYSGPITGYFGALTKAGVISYQRKNGLEQVGIVGPKTRALLNQ